MSALSKDDVSIISDSNKTMTVANLKESAVVVADRSDTSSSLFNSMISTKECMSNLIDEIETLSKELIVQTINSNRIRINESSGDNELYELTKIIIQKQNQLNSFLKIASEQQQLHMKISRLKGALVDRDTDIKNLLLYLKEAEQVLASAVYQSRQKLSMIKKAKPLPSELIIRYAHKISAGFGVCCPENWTLDNPIRPYPTDVDMRRGWLAKLATNSADLGLFDEAATANAATAAAATGTAATTGTTSQEDRVKLVRSNSKMIDPIVPQEFGFAKEKFTNNSTEFMSDSSSDTSSDSDSNMT